MLRQTIDSRCQSFIFLFVLSVGTLTLAGIASAAINYGDFSDVPPGAVMYLDVTETANSPDDDEPLFDRPSIFGNVLEFDPTVRFATSANNGLNDDTEGTLQFGLSGEGTAIKALALNTDGMFSLSGNGTASTAVTMRSSIAAVSVLAIDGLPVAAPIVLPEVSALQTFDLSSGAASSTPWKTHLSYDLSAELSSMGIAYQHGATKIEVSLISALGSSSEASSSAQASIEKFIITPETIPVPEPAGLTLAGLAIFALSMNRSSGTR